jgi:hypothetical protein
MPAKLKAKQAKADAKKEGNAVSQSKVNKKDTKIVDSRSVSKSKKPSPQPLSPPKALSAKKNHSKDIPKSKLAPKVPSPKKVLPKKKVCSPAKDSPKRKAPASEADNKKDVTNGVKKTKSDELIVKVITKGGAAVDSLVPNKDSYRVYQ